GLLQHAAAGGIELLDGARPVPGRPDLPVHDDGGPVHRALAPAGREGAQVYLLDPPVPAGNVDAVGGLQVGRPTVGVAAAHGAGDGVDLVEVGLAQQVTDIGLADREEIAVGQEDG